MPRIDLMMNDIVAYPTAVCHAYASAVPTDAAINLYVPAGTRHYGVTSK